MARVDFYVLKDSGELSRRTFACRLAEKAYRLKHRVHVHTDDARAAADVDELLWTFRDGSFVPHELIAGSDGEADSPVTIGHGALPALDAQLLINLGSQNLADTDTFPRIAEIVTSDDDSRRDSRNRYAQYREKGHALETHKL